MKNHKIGERERGAARNERAWGSALAMRTPPSTSRPPAAFWSPASSLRPLLSGLTVLLCGLPFFVHACVKVICYITHR